MTDTGRTLLLICLCIAFVVRWKLSVPNNDPMLNLLVSGGLIIVSATVVALLFPTATFMFGIDADRPFEFREFGWFSFASTENIFVVAAGALLEICILSVLFVCWPSKIGATYISCCLFATVVIAITIAPVVTISNIDKFTRDRLDFSCSSIDGGR